MAFQAFGQGKEYLRQEQVTKLLLTVFTLLLATMPDAQEKAQGASALELAESTAEQCFVEKDVHHTGLISMQDFHEFFEESGF